MAAPLGLLGFHSDRDSTTSWNVEKGQTYNCYHRKVSTQRRQLPPESVGRNVLRSSLYLQQVAVRSLQRATPHLKMYGKEGDITRPTSHWGEGVFTRGDSNGQEGDKGR